MPHIRKRRYILNLADLLCQQTRRQNRQNRIFRPADFYPAMQSFFYICEYLGVTPQEFFDEGNACPEALQEFIEEARKLDSRSMSYILGIMKELNSKR